MGDLHPSTDPVFRELWAKQPPPVCTIVRLSNGRVRRAKNSSRHLTSTVLSSIDVFLRSLRFHVDINSAKRPPRWTNTKPASGCRSTAERRYVNRSRPSVVPLRRAEPHRSACAFPHALKRLYDATAQRKDRTPYVVMGRC
jgi:hypothetical protein